MSVKQRPEILYGVKYPNKVQGEIRATAWCDLRAPDRWGRMTGDEDVWWFFDPGVRDEFRALFGGIQVTVRRKESAVHVGDAALKVLSAVQNKMRKAG